MNQPREYSPKDIRCFSYRSTNYIYTSLIAALLPSIIWSVYIFGYMILATVIVPIATALFVEYLVTTLSKKYTPLYIHALWIGLLIGAFMPPRVSLLIPFTATLFTMLVAKWTFGGVEQCWINPAAVALTFARISYSAGYANGWVLPKIGYAESVDLSALPLSQYSNMSSSIDNYLVELINNSLSSFNVIVPQGFFDALLGVFPGTIGGGAVIFLLIGAVIVVARNVINWHVPLFAFISYAVVVFIFGGEDALFTGNILSKVLRDGFLLGIFFLATDITSIPSRNSTILLYGILIGIFAFLFQDGGGIVAAVLLANVLCQLSISDRRYITRKVVKKI